MTTRARRLVWRGDTGAFATASAGGPALVVDSWLVSDGLVRGLDLHRERFVRACAALAGVRTETTGAFFTAAVEELPRSGDWFPRVEYAPAGTTGDAAAGAFRLWIRPAPQRGSFVRMWVPEEADQRRHPAVKGPDLPYLLALRDRALAAGADEALLLGPGGQVLEGTTTSLLWWRGDKLCMPPDEAPALHGVTRRLIRAIAGNLWCPVGFEYVTLADLDGVEVWTVNALHGIRPVSAWAQTALRAPAPTDRLHHWRRLLTATSAPI
ncbi:aminotransferase class IV [Actinomadura macrotermitis]|uniref:Branched-chain amino acid aminotransferase/4-amino-4-deoxychorismate lyase n=1 Tax=Actinomadura macrotermitis TaxID=2585200 RepID=A0A7K0BWJ5_9ACTN|nr:aminotransferase class IV [Actinomadura macrotermitis]MQY05054.1 hypothetical protein [Actinomadura macrotermitis]